jgi:PAS domain S-box-containing protein
MYWATTVASPYKDDSGNIEGYLILQQDISKQKQLETELKESENLYRSLIENSLDGVVLTQDFKFLLVNPVFVKMMGYTHEELRGIEPTTILAPEDKERVVEYHRKRLAGELKAQTYNASFIRKDGSLFIAELNSSSVVVNGRPGSLITMRDITKRELLQKALIESEAKYRSLIENANDGVVITQNGLLKFANKAMCELMQYPLEELMEKSFFSFVPKEEHPLMREYHERRMKGEDFNVLYRSLLIRKDGCVINIELNSRTESYNNHPAAFIIIRDITERVRIETELKIAKEELELLNRDLENRIIESSEKLTEANTQLIRVQKENLQSQFEVLRQQVNPHFLFNSLNVLTSLIKLEPDLAEKFTEHLSKVYRYVLENKDNDMVSLNTELDFLDAYLFLLNIRFLDKIKVNIDLNIDRNKYLIVPLALQLIIENAIKHNSMSKKNPLTIKIFVDEQLMLNIINNLQERESHMISTGVGLTNIAHRYELLELPAPEFYKTETLFVAKIPLKAKD